MTATDVVMYVVLPVLGVALATTIALLNTALLRLSGRIDQLEATIDRLSE